ncbi:hypothetical protein RHMOL_Rhmol02G0098100 [Rhododendron molle]|uniref:Uncharacterized protein n=1 Tax=Rhododendron molle TaxID=49168 RepID=A0ACC0PN61_RHOML|nr:hypothetical protein RHMOL_Rhmol02G0098100 [Rhododendron molle]
MMMMMMMMKEKKKEKDKDKEKKKKKRDVFKMDGGKIYLSHEMLHEVFKPRGHMSTLLFLPVLLTDIEHWYCVVVNLVDKRIEVLDSMELRSTDKNVATRTVVGMLFNVLTRTRTKRQLPTPWTDWHGHELEVPQQSNTHDCGFYTSKFMEHWTGGRMNTRELEVNSRPNTSYVIHLCLHRTLGALDT